MKRAKGNGEFAHVIIRLEPGDRGSGIVFGNETKGGVVPKVYFPAIEKGIRNACTCGPIGSYPVVDIRVTLIGGSFHEYDSSCYAFEMAAHRAMTLAMKEAEPRLLEPIMLADITVPHQFVGTVMADMGRKNGKVVDMEGSEDDQVISVEVPMREMFGYATRLRSTTQGMGTFSMQFSRFDFAPIEVQERVRAGLRT